MAKQTSFVKLKGSMGDVTFVKTKDGYLAKQKTSMNGDRIANGESFARTRENNAEFGRAAGGVKLLRKAIKGLLSGTKDSTVTARLMKEMVKVVKTDITSDRGQRNIVNGEIEMLRGFEFNRNANLDSIVKAAYTMAIDRVTGKLEINIPTLIPMNHIDIPEGTTHFAIVSAGVDADFENDAYTEATSSSGILLWDGNDVGPVKLTNQLAANSTHSLILVLGVQFYQQVNGGNYALNNAGFNPLTIVKVSGV